LLGGGHPFPQTIRGTLDKQDFLNLLNNYIRSRIEELGLDGDFDVDDGDFDWGESDDWDDSLNDENVHPIVRRIRYCRRRW